MNEQTNVKSLLKERLGQDLLSILERISQVASRSEVTVLRWVDLSGIYF